MSDHDRIEKGDKVYVHFAGGHFIEGIVEYIPCATGDSWIIKGALGDEARIYYVQTFQYMTLLAKGKP